MVYVVYNDNGVLNLCTKYLAKSQGIEILKEFSNFYEAVEYCQMGE